MTPNNVVANCQHVIDIRLRKGWTQMRLAAETELGGKTIWNIENGKPVRTETLEAVARKLGVPLSDLVAASPSPAQDRGPTTPPPPNKFRIPAPSLASSTPASAAKCSLLIVEDDPGQLDILRRCLYKSFDVTTAANADAAEAMFAHRTIDILLTDQMMPRRTGVELLEWVRHHHPRTVCLLMTGYPELNTAIEAINRGQVFHFVPKPWNVDSLLGILQSAAEKVTLERARHELLLELDRRNRELEDANRQLQQRTIELEQEAQTDPLTGLYNRRTVEELARSEICRRVRYPRPLSLGLIKVDPTDRITSDPLSPGSEEVIQEISSILYTSLRRVDSIGRLHGELFLVIAREIGEEGASHLAERIRGRVASTTFVYSGQVVPITISVAFAVCEAGINAGLSTIIEIANTALREVQAGGGNRTRIRVVQPTTTPDADSASAP